jgi:hypothetical protein
VFTLSRVLICVAPPTVQPIQYRSGPISSAAYSAHQQQTANTAATSQHSPQQSQIARSTRPQYQTTADPTFAAAVLPQIPVRHTPSGTSVPFPVVFPPSPKQKQQQQQQTSYSPKINNQPAVAITSFPLR